MRKGRVGVRDMQGNLLYSIKNGQYPSGTSPTLENVEVDQKTGEVDFNNRLQLQIMLAHF